MNEKQGEYEISSDGKTVWINGPLCVGRFCRFGIDVLDGIRIKMTTPARPVGGAKLVDWQVFQTLMLDHYGVEVSNRHAPEFLHHPWRRKLDVVLRRHGFEGERLEQRKAEMLERFPMLLKLWDDPNA